MIDLAYVREQMEMNKRKEILDKHPYKISQGADGKWRTYLPDKEKGRKQIKRSTQKSVEDAVVTYWKAEAENPTIKEVFNEWNDRRLELKKIQKSTHLRNIQIFERHYSDFGKEKIKSVTPEEFEEFLEEQIPKHNLSGKAFLNLKSVTRGFLKRAKKLKLISFNVNDIFDELDVSDRDFGRNVKVAEDEVFNEEEMSKLINWMSGQEMTLLNLGILLTFVTGVRVGELATLKWSDWDGYAFHIHRTETRYKEDGGPYKYEVKEYPKTPAGLRTVVVPQHCIWIIKDIRKQNPFGEFVFEKNGNRIKTYSFRRKLYSICNLLKIKQKSPHKVRKTYASILLDNEIPEKHVIELMGHTDISCTKEFYSRDRKSSEKKAELLDKIPEFHIGIM